MVRITEHYKKRFKERVSKSANKAELMADSAYMYGSNMEDIRNHKLKKYLKNVTRSCKPGTFCKVYRGYIYWFCNTMALTVYSLPVMRHVQ